jgi:hypothetical protein
LVLVPGKGLDELAQSSPGDDPHGVDSTMCPFWAHAVSVSSMTYARRADLGTRGIAWMPRASNDTLFRYLLQAAESAPCVPIGRRNRLRHQRGSTVCEAG